MARAVSPRDPPINRFSTTLATLFSKSLLSAGNTQLYSDPARQRLSAARNASTVRTRRRFPGPTIHGLPRVSTLRKGSGPLAGARKMGPRPTSRYQRRRASCNRRAIPLSRWMACNRREMTWRSAPSWTCRKSDADTPRPLAHRRTSRKVITLRGDERVLRYFLLGKLIEILDSLPHQAHDLLAA